MDGFEAQAMKDKAKTKKINPRLSVFLMMILPPSFIEPDLDANIAEKARQGKEPDDPLPNKGLLLSAGEGRVSG